jgi:hypothetical protein
VSPCAHFRESCQASVHGFSGQQFRGFNSRADAELWLADGRPSPPSTVHDLQASSPSDPRCFEDDSPESSSDSASKRQKVAHAPTSDSPSALPRSVSSSASASASTSASSDDVAAPSGSAGDPDMFQLFVHGRVSTRSTPTPSSGGALSPTNAPPASCAAIAWILRRGVGDDATHVCEGTLLVSNISCRYVSHPMHLEIYANYPIHT